MTSIDLRQLSWVINQWKRFRRVLCVCTGLAWCICCTGIALSEPEDLLIILSLAFMLIAVTGLSAHLLWTIRRELQSLDKQVVELRAEGHR